MSSRKQRGLLLARQARIVFDGKHWVVPSESTALKSYLVDIKKKTCTCKDFDNWGDECKHIVAASEVERWQREGIEPPEPPAEPERVPKPSYKQHWPSYNRAQKMEKERVMFYLRELCKPLEHEDKKRPGRPRIPLADAVFTVVYKVYEQISSRRLIADLQTAHDMGYIENVMSHGSIINCMGWKGMKPVLQHLIQESARPLGALESKLLPDSTGFSSHRWERWYDEKWGIQRTSHYWAKAHMAVGPITNAVFGIVVTGRKSNDADMFRPLMERALTLVNPTEVCADAGYLSKKNLQFIVDAGATPFIPFKHNSTTGSGGLWAKMLHFFRLHNEEFRAKYHIRSNAESTFSAIKRLFGANVFSRDRMAIVNEVLCKVLCYNLTCVNHAQELLGIEADWWSPPKPAA